MSQSNYLKSLIRDLTPLEVFDYYDGPKFYSCCDSVGQIFLVYWIEQNENSVSWLYLRVSQERYIALKQGNISIASALANPEQGYVFLVNVGESVFSIEEITSSKIPKEWLPEENDFLEIPVQTLPQQIIDPLEAAKRTSRHVLDIAFDKVSNTYEMGAGKLGQILVALQSLIYSLGCNNNKDIRRVPEEVKVNSEFLVTGLFASSFGVRLQSRRSDIFGTDATGSAIESLSILLNKLKLADSVQEELYSYNVLSRSRFKHFLKVMIDSNISVKTDWGAPDGRRIKSKVSYSEMLRVYQAIDATDEASKTVVVRNVELVGVDIESDFFAAKVGGGRIIKGKLSSLISDRHFDIPSRILATIEETCIVDPLTDNDKWTYVLLDFQST